MLLNLALGFSLRDVLEDLGGSFLQLFVVRGHLEASFNLLLNAHCLSLDLDLLFTMATQVLVLNDGLHCVAEVLHVECQLISSVTVSYTHLTLPTIYSV